MLTLLCLLACPKPAPPPVADPTPVAQPTALEGGLEPIEVMGGGFGSLGGGLGGLGSPSHPSMDRSEITVDPTQPAVVQLVQTALRGDTALAVDADATALLAKAGWPADGNPNDLHSAIRADCIDVVWADGDGYSAVAVPPAMTDDTPEQAAIQDQAIAMLQGTTEVITTCTIVVQEEECWGATEDGEAGCETIEDEYEAALFSIALRESDGAWMAVGWRNFTTENPLAH